MSPVPSKDTSCIQPGNNEGGGENCGYDDASEYLRHSRLISWNIVLSN